MLKTCFIIFFISLTSLQASLHPSRIKPEIRITEAGEVSVSWETANPAAKSYVLYGAEEGLYHQPFPDYYFRGEDRRVGKSHTVILKDIKPGILYNFRVGCIDTVTWSEIRSLNYTFLLIKNGNTFQQGIVITEGPLIANVTTTSLVVAWKTNVRGKGELWYWTKDAKKPHKLSTPTVSNSFELAVTGLAKDKEYSYKIMSITSDDADTIVTPTYAFRTAPDQAQEFSFVVFGDCRSGREANIDYRLNGVNYTILNRLITNAGVHNPRFFLSSGDQSDGATTERDDAALQYETWKKAVAIANAQVPFYAGMGNHDSRSPHIKFGRKGAYDPPPPNSAEDLWAENFVLPTNSPEPNTGYPPFKENVYSFDYANTHVICLNSNYQMVTQDDSIKYKDAGFTSRVGEPQLQWLKDDLKKAQGKLIVVYIHDNFYPTGGHVGSALDKFPAERDALWKLLESNNVSIVFCGHEHIYSRVTVDKTINPIYKKSIYQITAGGGGAPTYAQDKKVAYLSNVLAFKRAYHYVLVTVKGKRIQVQAFTDNNEKIDEVEF